MLRNRKTGQVSMVQSWVEGDEPVFSFFEFRQMLEKKLTHLPSEEHTHNL